MSPSIRASRRPPVGRPHAYDVGVPTTRLLFSSAAFFARPLAATFRIVAETGYSGVEVMVTKDPASQDPATMRALAKEHDLTIGAIHAPSLLVTRKVWGTDPIGKIDRAVQVAEEAEVPVVVMHPPYRWQRAYRRWLDDELPRVEARTGVTVAIENMFPVRMGRRARHLPREPGPRRPGGLAPPRARHEPCGGRRATTRSRCGGASATAFVTCICPTTRARAGTRTCRPAMAYSTSPRSAPTSRAAGTTHAVSLEVDLRTYLTDPIRLRTVMVDMREHAERMLGPDASAAQGQGNGA